MPRPETSVRVKRVVVALLVCLAVAACTESADPTTTTVADSVGFTAPTEADDYFEVLREIQTRVRNSPDYLPGEIERLAARGDREEILEFVRENFTVVPPHPTVWVSVSTAQLWGVEGALRSAHGTPREIAEVLARALELAGYDTRIVTALGPATRLDILNPAMQPAFAPDPGVGDVLEATGRSPLEAVEPLAAKYANRFGDNVMASLEDGPVLTAFTSDQPQGMPTVVIDDGDTMLQAGLWTAEGGFESVDFVTEAADAAPTPDLGIRLLVATSDDPRNPVEVASAIVSHGDMVGRRVTINFVPGVSSVAELFSIAPADVASFVPTIRIGGPGEEPEILGSGTPLLLDGRIVDDSGDGLEVGEVAFGGTGDPSTAVGVAIKRVNVWRYPWVDVDVEVVDDAGSTIDDLPGTAFTVFDEGDARPLLLTRAITPPPRVVFLLDDSLSVPEELRDQAAAEIVGSIAARVREGMPDAEFRVSFMGSAGALDPSPWVSDLDLLRDEVIGFGGGSGVWDSYAEASLMGGDAIVVLTDGLSADGIDQVQPEPTPDSLPLLVSAPPAVVIGAGEFGDAWQGLAEITGGIAITAADTDLAVAAVLEQLDALASNYTLRYRAPSDSTGERAMAVTVGGGPSAAASYEVPLIDPAPVGHAGLYLEFTHRGVVHTRTLAGIPFRTRREPTTEHIEDVRRAMFGTYTLVGEPGPPTPSMLVDDVIRSALQWEEVLEATGQDQLDALTRVTPAPATAATFSLPVADPTATPRTVDLGMRFWLGTERPALAGDTEVWRRGVDLVPINRFVTLADDADDVLAATVTRTGRLSMLEAVLFEISPAERLAAADLIPLAEVDDQERRAAFQAVVGGWPGDTRFLVPTDGPPDALAAIRPDGTLIAVGATGEGVGITEEEANQRFDEVDSLLDMAGSLGGGPGAWAELEKAKMDKLRFATIAIIRMDADGVADLIEEEVCDAISSAGDSIIDSGIRHAGLGGIADSLSEAVEMIDAVAGAAGLDSTIPTGVDAC